MEDEKTLQDEQVNHVSGGDQDDEGKNPGVDIKPVNPNRPQIPETPEKPPLNSSATAQNRSYLAISARRTTFLTSRFVPRN